MHLILIQLGHELEEKACEIGMSWLMRKFDDLRQEEFTSGYAMTKLVRNML